MNVIQKDNIMGSGWKKNLFWLIPILILDALLLFFYFTGNRNQTEHEKDILTKSIPPSQLESLVFPTDQMALLDPDAAGVFQPTATGRIESAFYGSTRTRGSSQGLSASFHEGIDIASMRRDKRGRPMDHIYAIADGHIAYVNKIAGNSNYGIYVVILHNDPLGRIYSLYAHLAETAKDIFAGQKIESGHTIGKMGNTPTHIVPMARAHLHLEIGLVMNDKFAEWYKRTKLKPYHANYHGWNLQGVDPIALFKSHKTNHKGFSMLNHLNSIPIAFEIAIRTEALPDFFVRYPRLWKGNTCNGKSIIITCSENGTPLSGRNTDEQEALTLGKSEYAVTSIDLQALGRNGARLIQQKSDTWTLSSQGEKWLSILLYGAEHIAFKADQESPDA